MTIRRETGLLATNSYIHIYEKGAERKAILIDAGGQGRELAQAILDQGAIPALIVLSHGHLDHTAGAKDFQVFWEKRGIKVPCAIHSLDANYVGTAGYAKNRGIFESIDALDFFDSVYRPLPEPDMLLEDGQAILDSGLKVFHSPGHTRGSICLVSDAQRLIYSGDTLFRGGVGRTDLPDGDAPALSRSLAALFQAFPDDYVCYPGHGGKTSLKDEKHGYGY